jgi:ribosome-associated translation inhibitor RaiA
MSKTPTLDLVVEVRGSVPGDAAEYARTRIAALARHAHEPVLSARAKLTEAADPAVASPAIAQANLDLNGRLVRAHVAAATMREAIDLLHDRLARRLERMARHWEARRGGRPTPGEHGWRHSTQPTHRPDYYPRPADQRQILRHKAFTLAVATPDEAAFDMDAMDYDFHLFTDADTGRDSVIYRGGPTGYRMACTAAVPEPARPAAVSLTVSSAPAPCLAISDAIERLELTGQPFVFFIDADTDRGTILYHRYDGHYGLITPAE